MHFFLNIHRNIHREEVFVFIYFQIVDPCYQYFIALMEFKKKYIVIIKRKNILKRKKTAIKAGT